MKRDDNSRSGFSHQETASSPEDASADTAEGKTVSLFYSQSVRNDIQRRCPPGSAEYERAVREAAPFAAKSDEELWRLMYDSRLKRSYHVFSNGYCPSCQAGVPLHTWQIDVMRYPWKVGCPHCGELFPKNDFQRYYESGLGEDGLFHASLADRRFLIAELAEGSELASGFGVDDGNGYVQDGDRWYFIAYYLLFGHWHQVVLEAIKNLARAYVITGQQCYARQAVIVLARLADLYPNFDFKQQGIIYEKENYDDGFISYWFRSCTDIRDLTLAYDMVIEGAADDEELVCFICNKSAVSAEAMSKRTWGEISEHIENRLLRETIRQRYKIESNFPMTDTTICLIRAVLEWERERDALEDEIDRLIRRATAVDGTTGEKGMVTYSAYALFDLAMFLLQLEQVEPGYIAAQIRKHPALVNGYRFFVDMWCLERYYPRIGNTGSFVKPDRQYAVFQYRDQFFTTALDPDVEYFLWQLYKLTGDVDLARVIYVSGAGNEERLERLFVKSLLTPEPEQLRKEMEELICKHGPRLEQASVNKERWRLAVLHNGRGEDRRAVWMKYDSGGDHGHFDGMSIGLFAKGLDLLPDFGYAPVQYGLFREGPEQPWYYSSAAHNTVVVDGQNHRRHEGLLSDIGVSELFVTGGILQAIRASAPEMIGGGQFERTLLAITLSDEDSYYVDLFRVQGGREHIKYSRSTISTLTMEGTELRPLPPSQLPPERTHGGMLQQWMVSDEVEPGQWRAVWQADDCHFRVNDPERQVALHYLDLTADVELMVAQSWVDLWPNEGSSQASDQQSAWIPTVMLRRQGGEGLRSEFIGLYEPVGVEGRKLISACQHTPEAGGIVIEVKLQQQMDDLLLIASKSDDESEGKAVRYEWGDNQHLTTDSEMVFIRRLHSEIKCIVIVNGSELHMEGMHVQLAGRCNYAQFAAGADGLQRMD